MKAYSPASTAVPTPSLVSIIIPVYNGAPYLEAALRSALAQTWMDIEIIVVDDGSQDDSVAIARRFVGSRVRLLEEAHRGAAATRNVGLAAAHGSWIQFLDCDDLLAPDKIAQQMGAAPPQPGARTLLLGKFARFLSTAEGERNYLWPDGRYRPEFPSQHAPWRNATPIDCLLQWWNERLETTPLPWLIPATLIAAAGPWAVQPLSRCDDFEWITRLILSSDEIVLTPEAQAYYRNHVTGSLSSSGQARKPQELERQLEAYKLCVQHLRKAEDTDRTRRVSAALLMNFAYDAYASASKPANEAARLARSLGVPLPECPGGRISRILTQVIGWRASRRCQAWAIRAGYMRSYR